MAYVEGFIVPVPKDRLEDYKAMARLAREVWTGYGALNYVEAVGDDVPVGELTSFPRAVQLKDDEVVVLSWIVYPSREARETIARQAMDDARFDEWKDRVPFDGKRMVWGGFVPFIGMDA